MFAKFQSRVLGKLAMANYKFFAAIETVFRRNKREAISDIKQNLIVITFKNLHANYGQLAN